MKYQRWLLLFSCVLSSFVLFLGEAFIPVPSWTTSTAKSSPNSNVPSTASTTTICTNKSCLSFASVLFLRSIRVVVGVDNAAATTVAIRRKSTVLGMGKGDGKKRRKKKSADSSIISSQPPPTTIPAPPRVSTQINISVRQQILYSQLNKQQQQQQGSAGFRKRVERTSYRRAWDEEEIQLKAAERKKRGQDPDWDVILNRTATAPLVIVDGYNIIMKWSRLKKHMVKGDPQLARQLLIDDLENLRSLKGWRIEVVFDGTKRSTIGPLGQGPSGSNRLTRVDQANRASVTKHGVRSVFTGVGIEADSYIEKRCAEARNVTNGELTGSFIVATDDAMIRLAGQGAGAHCMGADRFVSELKAVKKGMEYRVEAAVAKINGHAIRPEKLRNKGFAPRFGRRSVLIEDKRNRTKSRAQDEEYELELEIEEVTGVPWWAQVPNQTKPYR